MLDKHIARLEAAAQEGRWSGLQASTAITVAAHRWGSPTARRFAASNAGAWYSHRRCCRRLLRIWPEQSAAMPADRVSRMRAQLSGWLSAFLRRAEALEGSQHNVLLPVVRVEHALKGLEHGSVSAKEVRPRTSPDLCNCPGRVAQGWILFLRR